MSKTQLLSWCGPTLKTMLQTFTAIHSSLKRKLSSSHPESTRAKRINLDESERLFPKLCFFCKQGKTKLNKRTHYPYKIPKGAALLTEDEQLLLHVGEVDLTAKEFMMQ